MQNLQINEPTLTIDLKTWELQGDGLINSVKLLSQLCGVFADEDARKALSQDTVVYRVQAHLPLKEGTPGGLYFGTSIVMPGKVGNEYFMTRGHLHANADRTEYYWGVQGTGILILMDSERNTYAEKIFPGSLHHIGPHIAHRIANTGDEPLFVGACWPSDAGHNYDEIDANGFSARLLDKDGVPTLIKQ